MKNKWEEIDINTPREAIEGLENYLKWHDKELQAPYKKSLKLAINALEKQVAKQPLERFNLAGVDKGGKCPTCGNWINNASHWCYCECGQKINWSYK